MTRNDDDDGRRSVPEDRPDSANLLAPLLGLIGIGALVYAMSVLGLFDSPTDALSRCAAISDSHTRLTCFDQLASPRPPARGALAPLGAHQRERSP